MTDVMTRCSGNAPVNNGSVIFSASPNFKRYVDDEPEINRTTAISGYNGTTTNGYLDTRFDDPDYYTA